MGGKLLPLPAPPSAASSTPSSSDDRRSVEAARAAVSVDSKVAALRSYRRAMGLYYKCNEKWSRDHKCSLTV
jgi:hypothetical protein